MTSSKPIRVLVVEDDPDAALWARTVISAAGLLPTVARSAAEATAALRSSAFDVALVDIEIPDGDGIVLAEELGSSGVAVAITSAHTSVDRTIAAMRSRASDFLPKPVPATVLVSTLERLAEDVRRWPAPPRRRIAAIGAHPDDVEIGVGGTLAAHATAGDELLIITLSRGARGGEQRRRVDEAHAVAARLGASLVLADLPDTAIPEGDPTIGLIEEALRSFLPDTVYVHSPNDTHQDHRAVHRATLVAARDVPTIACYQSPSATTAFSPTRFVDVGAHLEQKLSLIGLHASQATSRSYLDPEVIRSTARYWARHARGSQWVEPFELLREHLIPLQPPTRSDERHPHARIPAHLLAR